jgi:hypothetical protein
VVKFFVFVAHVIEDNAIVVMNAELREKENRIVKDKLVTARPRTEKRGIENRQKTSLPYT